MTAPPVRRHPVTERVYMRRFGSTPLGARLARHRALHQLRDWGVPDGADLSDAAAVIVAELAANAVTHGRVPGRDFELRLTLTPDLLRIEVSDTRTEHRPNPAAYAEPPPQSPAESGRGLLLVEALADRWTVADRDPVGKTVSAELHLPR